MAGGGPAEYRPIDCGLHDRLEALATLRSRVPIHYLDAMGSLVEVEARIVDLHTRGGEEFLETDSGTEIRLDHLVSVAGVAFR